MFFFSFKDIKNDFNFILNFLYRFNKSKKVLKLNSIFNNLIHLKFLILYEK